MNIPGAYPGEHPILAVWHEGGNIHNRWSCWTVHSRGEPDGLLLRHSGGFYAPLTTTEGKLPDATFARVIEHLSMVSIPLASKSLHAMTDCSYTGVMYDSVYLRWYGCAPEGWEGLERWYSETTQLFERVLGQTFS